MTGAGVWHGLVSLQGDALGFVLLPGQLRAWRMWSCAAAPGWGQGGRQELQLPSQLHVPLLCLQLYRGKRGDFVQVMLPSEQAAVFMLGELGSFGRPQKRGDARWLDASSGRGLGVRMKILGSIQPPWWVQHRAASPCPSTVLGHSFPSCSMLRIEDV